MEGLLILLLKWKVIELVASAVFIGLIIVLFLLVAIFDGIDMKKRRKSPTSKN